MPQSSRELIARIKNPNQEKENLAFINSVEDYIKVRILQIDFSLLNPPCVKATTVHNGLEGVPQAWYWHLLLNTNVGDTMIYLEKDLNRVTAIMVIETVLAITEEIKKEVRAVKVEEEKEKEQRDILDLIEKHCELKVVRKNA